MELPLKPMLDNEKMIDLIVGSNIRALRKVHGRSQADIGELFGLSFQQIQKYERGTNRLGAGKLFQFSLIFDVPVNTFYSGVPDFTATTNIPDARSVYFSHILAKAELIDNRDIALEIIDSLLETANKVVEAKV